MNHLTSHLAHYLRSVLITTAVIATLNAGPLDPSLDRAPYASGTADIEKDTPHSAGSGASQIDLPAASETFRVVSSTEEDSVVLEGALQIEAGDHLNVGDQTLTVDELWIDGIPQPAGIYTSAAGFILGSGSLMVLRGTATPIEVKSPNNRHTLTITPSEKNALLNITSGEQKMLVDSVINLRIEGTEIAAENATVINRETVNREVNPLIPGHASTLTEHYNEVLIQFGDNHFLRARAYNEGVAYRWEVSGNASRVIIDGETLELNFSEPFSTFFPEPNGQRFFSHQESKYPLKNIDEIPGSGIAHAPLLVNTGPESHLLITDVNVEGYPGLWLEGSGPQQIRALFPPYPLETELEGDRHLKVAKEADFIAKTPGNRQFPWRAFAIDSSSGLLTNALPYLLAEPSRIADPSWIEPGKVAWDWWNANNIYDVPFRAGINNDTYKHYVDFAASINARYIILDEGWSEPGPGNLLSVVPEIDIPELVAYGKAKDVRIILWMTSTALEQNFDAAFEQFAAWDIAGIKVDFMQRDDQPMMEFLYRTAEAAAEKRILVNFHGGSKPTGLHRTWPNVLTFESVLGLEQSKWGEDANPEMAVTLPFTRMFAGPMDYTPGGMVNLQKSSFRSMFNTPATQGTRAHQLAMYVVFLSPLQMLADTPTNYRRNPESLPFLKEVPVVWDETRVLHADVGNAVAVARRSGTRWFIGALTDWTAREIELRFDFLAGGTFTLTAWADGPNADRNGNDVATSTASIKSEDTLSVRLAPGGGYAAIIEPN